MPSHRDLQAWLGEEERELQERVRERDRINADIAKREQIVAHLRHLMALKNGGSVTQQMVLRGGRFKDVALREAILIVLQEQKSPASLDAVCNALLAGGFDFSGKSPKRSAFIALENLTRRNDGIVERQGQGRDSKFRLKGGPA